MLIVVADFMTIPELARELGERLRTCRLRRRMEQTDSLLRVMKALGILEGLEALVPQEPSVDPLLLLKRKKMPGKVYKRRKPDV